MAGKKLQVALQVTADLNSARREVQGLNQDLKNTTQQSNVSTQAQSKVTASANNTAIALGKVSKSTNLNSSIEQFNTLDQSIQKVDNSNSKLTQSTNKVMAAMKNMGPQILAMSAASGGFVALAMDSVNRVSEMSNLNAVTGMGIEQFQMSAAAAKTVGIEMDKLSAIFQDSRDKVGDYLTEGGGELVQFFEEIAPKVGVTADMFKDLDGDQILRLYVKTLQEAGIKSNELVTHMERIASDSTMLTPLYLNNATALNQLGKEAKNTGNVLSESMVNDALEAQKAMNAVKAEITGLTNQMVANAAPAITFFAQNFDVLAQAGMIAASVYTARLMPSVVGYVKTLATELLAKGQAIYQSKVRATAALAEANAVQVKAAAELRSAQAAVAVASAGSTQAVAQTRLTAARAADTAATLAQSRAQEVYNTTMARSRLGAGALLGALGGPVGLAVAAAGVAASFMLMSDGSDEATDAFDAQRASIAELTAEYKKMNAEKKAIYMQELTEQLRDQQGALKDTASAMELYLEQKMQSMIGISGAAKTAIEQYFKEVQQGGETARTAFERLEKTKLLNDAELAKVARLGQEFNSNATKAYETQQKIDVLNGKTVDLGNASDGAATASNGLSNEIGRVGNQASNAKNQIASLGKAYNDYMQKINAGRMDNQMIAGLMNEGTSERQARMEIELLNAKNANPGANQTYGALTAEEKAQIAAAIADENQVTNIVDQRKKQEEAITKEKEKQNKISEQTQKINSTVLAQAKKYNYEGLENQYGLPRGLLASVSMQESKGNQNVVSPVGAKGAFQFMPATAERFGLKDRTDVGASAEAAAKYLSILLKMFNGNVDKTIMAYNAGEGNVQSGKAYGFKETRNYLPAVKRYMAGYNGLDGEDAQSVLGQIISAREEFLSQQKQTQLSIDMRFATEAQKLKSEYNDLVVQIKTAGYDQETLKTRLEQAEQEYQDKLTKRPEVLKRVWDSVESLESSWLEASGKTLDASVKNAEEKWKQPKADIAQLLMTEKDPTKADEYQSMLVKIDFVIEKEQLTLQFNDAMKQLDELQAMRKQRQETQQILFDSGQISQPQYAEQLQLIDAEMVPQLQTLAEQARILAEQLGDAFSVEKINAFVAGLTQVDGEFKKFLPTAEQLNERIAGGLTDAIMDFADGTKSAGDAFRQFASDFLREIAQMILKQMMFNMIKSAMPASGGVGGAISSGLSAIFGFMDGGHTGYGRRDEVAGVVHKDEWVITKPRTSEPGAKEFLSYFERYGMKGLNKFNGYMDGGLVGAPEISIPQMNMPKLASPAADIAQSTSFSANQNFYLVDDPSRILDTLNSSQGQENLVIMMSRDPSKFKSALKL